MSAVTPEKQREIDDAVADTATRHPHLQRVITAGLIGWPALDHVNVADLRLICQALIVKVGEYIDRGETEVGRERR